MRSRLSHCDSTRLRLLLDDELPAGTQSELVSHLDHCALCQQELEKLAADKSLWNELRNLNTVNTVDDLSSADSNPRCYENRPLGAGSWLADFLDAAPDPQHLGQLPGFAVTSLLGRGGMGVVLKAFDAALSRPVAIKVLAPYFASSAAARKRFEREARAAATVVHPHVVAIHGVSSWKGLPYLVMSYVAGRSLQERVDAEGPLDVKDIVRIGMQTAAGLAAAHAQGLVHRDVKPANILLENGMGRVWLTDFGLARAVDDASLTQSGVIAGTPQYMAPEQAKGDAVDHRADLFSLGSTMYTMCTGRPPFRAESAMAVLRRVCDDQPRSIRSVNPDIPAWLAGIIEKLLAKKPEDRFADAAAVAELLERCLAHLQQPEALALPPEAIRLTPPLPGKRRRRVRWAAAAILLGLSLTLVTLYRLPLGNLLYHQEVVQPEQDQQRQQEPRVTDDEILSLNREERSLESEINEMSRQTAALTAEMHQPAVAGQSDPTEALVQHARDRLDALERELTTPAVPK